MMESNPHACGVDDIASPSHTSKNQHASGAMMSPLSLRFPVPFPAWVISAMRYWISFGKRRGSHLALCAWRRGAARAQATKIHRAANQDPGSYETAPVVLTPE
jgi:hypothetical protein